MSDRWFGVDEVVAVAETRSFGAAAKRLGVSASTVSRAVAQLEQRLGAPLFHRTTRVVTLTDSGRTVVEQFRRLVMERDETFRMLDVGGEPSGLLRLTCPASFGERFIAPIVKDYLGDHPRLSVYFDLSNRVVDLVSEGFDLAIRTGAMPDSALVRTQVASRRLISCAAPAYLEARGRPVRVSDLAAHECIIGVTDTWRFRNGTQVQTIRPKGRLQCNSGMAVMEAAIAGLGICHLPEFYVNQAIERGRLIPILREFEDEDEPIWAVYPHRRHLLPKVQKLVERLRERLGPALRSGLSAA